MQTREKLFSVSIHDCEVQVFRAGGNGGQHWIPVSGFEGYFICAHGNVISTRKGAPRMLKAHADQDGYLHHVLTRDRKKYTIKVQRLVALHFIGPKPVGAHVCHNDGDKTNNCVENLRYDTPKANMRDKKIHGTQQDCRGENNNLAILTDDIVRTIRALYSGGGYTQRELGTMFGTSRENARDIINRKAWPHVA